MPSGGHQPFDTPNKPLSLDATHIPQKKPAKMAEVDTSAIADESFAHSEVPDDQPTPHPNTNGTPTTSNNNTNNDNSVATLSTANVTVGTRRQANGTIGSVYSGNKIKHLKKEDGIPLWRKDIQYQFLKLVFEDQTKVFTRQSDGQKGMDFADIYMDAMARSSKTSKILKDKLQNDKPAAISMAMVCLLVNFGRMNTTLNFFPEMRAQLRTYHSIPSLQAHQDPHAYKQLQDAPRLKSILKGASEDFDQPNTLEKIKRHAVPRTNPVNLIFVLAQYAPKVSELHFFPPRDFFDLVMRSTLSSASRAKAFLWLMWWYLESDFSAEAALNNPFGAGQEGEGTDGLPIKVPDFESLTEEQANEENIDTPEESEFGEIKRLERKRILEEDEPLPRVNKRSKKDVYDDDQASGVGRSGVSTPLHPSARQDEEDDLTPGQFAQSRSKRPKREVSPNRSVGQQRLVLKTKGEQTPDASSPAPSGSNPVVNRFVNEPAGPQPTSSRRPRPLTQHQIAVEQNRRERIGYLLSKRKDEAHKKLRIQRESEIPLARSARLITGLPDGYDSDDSRAWGPGGVILNPWRREDYGECPSFYLSAIRKATRRLDRWDYDNANGPKRDRKKEREERQRAKQQAIEFDNALSHSKYLTAQKRARATREARKKAQSEVADQVIASHETARAGVAADSQVDSTPTTTPAASRSAKSTKARTAAAKPTSAPLTEDAMDETLDDIDRELLGEDQPAAGIDESFVGDVDGALSSDVDADEEDLDEAEVDVEGDDHSLASDGEGDDVRNGDGGSEVSSAVGEPTPAGPV